MRVKMRLTLTTDPSLDTPPNARYGLASTYQVIAKRPIQILNKMNEFKFTK
jgi:hypothetical protein